MSALLNKRLARSLWKTKLRLISVVLMVFMGVFAGITFTGYASNLETMYDQLQSDTDSGGNLADLWIDNGTAVWSAGEVAAFCTQLESNWDTSTAQGAALDSCEGRMVVPGIMFHSNATGDHLLTAVWHGMPVSANADRLWMPEGETEGRWATNDREVVIDQHVAEVLDLDLGDDVNLTSGNGSFAFTVVGFAFHPLHVLMMPEGAIFPPNEGDFVVGYLSDEGLARMHGVAGGSANTILLDVEGTPSFDLPDTEADEGAGMRGVHEATEEALEATELDARVRDRGQHPSVEFLRQDLEGAKRTSTPFTVMIAVIASITIVLSLQRLVQSQAREIAVLRTLGVPRRSLMTGYLLAPIAIGAVGCTLGALAGPSGMHFMLDFYESFVGLPIVERRLDASMYATIIATTMTVVFVSGAFPAWKSSRLDPLIVMSGQHNVRVGSSTLKRLTTWMPTQLGLSIRSTFRKPIRLSMTFLAVGISLMLFGSIQMMTVGLEDTVVGGLRDDQTWDAQAYVMPGGDVEVIEWADDRDLLHERLIEMASGAVEGPDGVMRAFTVVGMNGYNGESMRPVNIVDGTALSADGSVLEVMMDEGSLSMLEWSLGEQRDITVNGQTVTVEPVGATRGEFARTMYFDRADLAELTGANATSVYLSGPNGVSVDQSLGELTVGVVERQDLLNGIETLLEQQTQFLQVMMAVGLMFTVVVMFNTMIMNISERDFELATLRVLGASTKSLGGMLLFESLIIGTVGGLVGVAFAYGGALGLAASFSSWEFYFPIVLVPSVAFTLMGGVLLIAVAMTPIGVWRLRRMDLVEKVKDLSQ